MKTIKRSLYFYTGAFTLLMIISLLFFIAEAQSNGLRLPFLLSLSALAAGLAIREYNRFKAARLILENRILHIRPAVIDHAGKDDADLLSESIEVFVSCFGILMGAKIVKFNQEGIRLKTVEIGLDYISLEYGTDTYTRKIRLLYAKPDSGRLADIAEKFRYETGVVPIITE
ncbi:MAG: hypothetical protein HPY74_15615 [Firmicutes bacterium]|nr:hypothetical protein [Bacillota bacterium]